MLHIFVLCHNSKSFIFYNKYSPHRKKLCKVHQVQAVKIFCNKSLLLEDFSNFSTKSWPNVFFLHFVSFWSCVKLQTSLESSWQFAYSQLVNRYIGPLTGVKKYKEAKKSSFVIGGNIDKFYIALLYDILVANRQCHWKADKKWIYNNWRSSFA